MKPHWIALCASLFAATLAVADDKDPSEAAAPSAAESEKVDPKFESLKAKVSYGIGMNLGNNLLRQGFDAEELDIDVDVLAQGLKDVLRKQQPQVSEKQLDEAMQKFQEQMVNKQQERQAQAKEAGEKFLAENAKKEGVKTTASGLQYQVITQGTGAKPKPTDTVKVHYRGTLIDGKEFDSSYKRGEPVTFGLDQVIAGWTEGVGLMPVGSKYKLFLPAKLGYGERGAPPQIPPHSALVFEVELLGIEK